MNCPGTSMVAIAPVTRCYICGKIVFTRGGRIPAHKMLRNPSPEMVYRRQLLDKLKELVVQKKLPEMYLSGVMYLSNEMLEDFVQYGEIRRKGHNPLLESAITGLGLGVGFGLARRVIKNPWSPTSISFVKNATRPSMRGRGATWDTIRVLLPDSEVTGYVDTTWGAYIYFQYGSHWYKAPTHKADSSQWRLDLKGARN